MDGSSKMEGLLKLLRESSATKWTVLSIVAGLTVIGSWYGIERLQSRARLQNGETFIFSQKQTQI
jgi:hypothetical protein